MFPLAVLALAADPLKVAAEAGSVDQTSLAESLRNVVELSDSAAAEIRRQYTESRFESDVVVRIEAGEWGNNDLKVVYDFIAADGCDWVGQSKGIPIVVDRNAAEHLAGTTIDFRNGTFVRS